MIKIIEGAQDPKTNPLFNEMFKQRTQVFKDELGWDIPLVNGLDIDVYDDENTVYLVDIDENGHVLGSVRLRATLAPHMMTGSFEAIFPHLSVKSPSLFEGSRLVTRDKQITSNGLSLSMTRLLLGLCEASMKSGITQLIAIIETPMLRLYQKCGLNPVVLGRAKTDHCSIMVCLWETNAKVLRNMREKLNYHASVLEDYAPYPLQLAA